jgi:hypothetical protein
MYTRTSCHNAHKAVGKTTVPPQLDWMKGSGEQSAAWHALKTLLPCVYQLFAQP